MRADQETRDIAQSLSSELSVAVSPDHPFLFEAPDLLVSNDEHLAAVFVPKQVEVKAIEKLLTRLVVSRLALPIETRCILMADLDQFSTNLQERLAWDFHAVLNIDDINELTRFLNAKEIGGRVKPIPIQIREQTYRRFYTLLGESERRHELVMQGLEPKVFRHRLLASDEFSELRVTGWRYSISDRPRRTKYARNIVTSGEANIGILSFETQQSSISKVAPFCQTLIQLRYVLDSGIPYPTEDFELTNLLVVDRVPFVRGDPFKAMRVSAFAGWVMTQIQSMDDFRQAMASIEGAKEEELRQGGTNEPPEPENSDDYDDTSPQQDR